MEKESTRIPMGSSGSVYPGIKLPNDGNFAFSQLERLQVSKQEVIQWVTSVRERTRPWATFFATTRYKAPSTPQLLPRRVALNIDYFQGNYLYVFVGIFVFCLITSPFLLLIMLSLFGVSYWIMANNRLNTVFGQKLSLPQQYSIMGLCSMPILYLAGAGAALFWVLGASFFLIVLHAVFYDIQSLLEPAEEGFDLTIERVI